MVASVAGSVEASFSRIRRASASIATPPMALRSPSEGPRMSRSVRGGLSEPPWVKRSPQRSVRVVDSNMYPHSQLWGRCGASSQRIFFLPSESSSPSARARGGRSAKSLTETIAAVLLHTGSARGATARKSFRAPHSSDSKCENPTYRSLAMSPSTCATASFTTGNERRSPVWKSRGSSSTTRIWLKVNPPGTTSTGVLIL
jgi:hypothetical protein